MSYRDERVLLKERLLKASIKLQKRQEELSTLGTRQRELVEEGDDLVRTLDQYSAKRRLSRLAAWLMTGTTLVAFVFIILVTLFATLHFLTSYATTERSTRVVLNGERLRTECSMVLEDPLWTSYHLRVTCDERGPLFDSDVSCQDDENGLECWQYGAPSFVMAERFGKAIVRDGADVYELWLF